MVSALDSVSSDLGSILSQGTVLCSWARHFALTVPLFTQGSIQLNFYKCNLQLWLLFSTSETIDVLVNYNHKSFIEMTPGV